MAKKAELLEEATKLGLEVSSKNTIAEIEKMISESPDEDQTPDSTLDSKLKTQDSTPPTAKAGKRSAKALKEDEEKAEKEERKEKIKSGEIEDKPEKRGPVPKSRSKLERRGKKYQEAAKKVEKDKTYDLKEGVKLAVETSTTKFDSTVEVHIKINADPKQADQNIRGTVVLPHGTGKEVRVAVFAQVDAHADAKAAGADIIGEDDFLKQLDKEVIDFDILISTPQLMAKLGKYARILGPKGLMPNPKSGTVTPNVAEAVKKAKAGQVEFRIDAQSICHTIIGKVSFGPDKLTDNLTILLKAINDVRPASIKAAYIENISVSSSMGPGIRIKQS